MSIQNPHKVWPTESDALQCLITATNTTIFYCKIFDGPLILEQLSIIKQVEEQFLYDGTRWQKIRGKVCLLKYV